MYTQRKSWSKIQTEQFLVFYIHGAVPQFLVYCTPGDLGLLNTLGEVPGLLNTKRSSWSIKQTEEFPIYFTPGDVPGL